MKHASFVLPLFLLIVSAFTACEKADEPVKTPNTEVTYSDFLPPDAKLLTWDNGNLERKQYPDVLTDCPYEDCKSVINHLLSVYQPLVDESCQPAKLAIKCCHQGSLVYAIVVIYPGSACFYTHPVTLNK